MEVYHLVLKLPTFLSRSWSPSVGGDRLKGPLQSFISEVEVVLSVSHCCKVRADVGWWFANFVCGIVTAELRNRLHLFEWWMVWGRLGSLCGESLWAVMDVVSPAILFTFSLLISFLCTQWAEAHSRRPVTQSWKWKHAHARMDSLTNSQHVHKRFTGGWFYSFYFHFFLSLKYVFSTFMIYSMNYVSLFMYSNNLFYNHWWNIVSVVDEYVLKHWTTCIEVMEGRQERTMGYFRGLHAKKKQSYVNVFVLLLLFLCWEQAPM